MNPNPLCDNNLALMGILEGPTVGIHMKSKLADSLLGIRDGRTFAGGAWNCVSLIEEFRGPWARRYHGAASGGSATAGAGAVGAARILAFPDL